MSPSERSDLAPTAPWPRWLLVLMGTAAATITIAGMRGVAELLGPVFLGRQIEHRALLTGNPEPVARARMEKLGLAEFFPPGQGAFGCDAEDRADLIDIARERAGDWRRERTVAVGDTKADVDGARRAGIHVIGFGPDPALAEADEVIEGMAELPAALERLSAAL